MNTENQNVGSESPLHTIRRLRKQAKKALKKDQTKLSKQQAELEEAEKWEWFKQIGDSLLADPDACPKGRAEREVINVHTQEIENVRLNPKCDAYRNAELYYKKGKKGKRGHEAAVRKVADSLHDMTRIESFIGDCDEAVRAMEAGEPIDEDAMKNLFARGKEYDTGGAVGAAGGVNNHQKVGYRHYHVENYDVYVGKTDSQNDELSTRFARPWDIWLHVAGHAGSHVVVRREKASQWPPHTVIEKAGALSVWFSKAKHTSYAEVHVTEARFVRKPRKSPPGQVVAERCKTVRVAPISPHEMFPGLYE